MYPYLETERLRLVGTGPSAWNIEHKVTNELIGTIGISRPGHWPSSEISWELAEAYRNQGLTTEAAAVVLAFGLDILAHDRLITVAEPDNVASIRVMQKLGLRLTNDTVCPLRHIPVVVYEAKAAKWQQ